MKKLRKTFMKKGDWMEFVQVRVLASLCKSVCVLIMKKGEGAE